MRTNDAVRKLYTDRGALYQRLFVDFLGWGRELEAFFRRTNYLRPNLKILDAGCGTGIITQVLYRLAQEQGHAGIQFHAFDLTPKVLEIFRQWITAQGVDQIELAQADVLETEYLPAHWKEYDLLVTSTMLEYLPLNQVQDALTNLMHLLASNGLLLIFMTRRNRLTRWLAGKWWKIYTYTERDIQALLQAADFDEIRFVDFSPRWSKSIMVGEAKKGAIRAQ
jgi:2-polyprenyl-3-methyl-5-hydroxy-6-metoxy-1,4-benzoquinol methylase